VSIPEIAVLVETDTGWGRNVVHGVAGFARRFGPWSLTVDGRRHFSRGAAVEIAGVDAVVGRIDTPILLNELLALGIPVVDVGDLFVGTPGIDSVLTDYAASAEAALDHFQSKGFKVFAHYAPPSRDYSPRRGAAFVEVVKRRGGVCSQYRPGLRDGREIGRDEHRRRVGRWIRRLAKPVAVLAADARRASDLAEVCARERLAVPEQVAILAGDTDDLECELCSPPLSSIDVAGRQIGFQSAARLAERLAGAAPLDSPLVVPPARVQPRQSTDVLAIEDPSIVLALRYMQTHACRGVTVERVLEQVPISRRQFERQFRVALGRSPAEELQRIKLERGRELLAQSELAIELVAEACGYAGSTQFGAAFRKSFGLTPLTYRRLQKVR